MARICQSLAKKYKVVLIGRQLKNSLPLTEKTFQQKRIRCFWNKGFLFYAEYNIRLFCYLVFQPMDGICAIDLDTILCCYVVSKIKNAKRVYDAHELFTEMKEVRSRPFVHKVWTAIERFAVPKFDVCYTVSEGLSAEFYKRYKKTFSVIRNLPCKREATVIAKGEKFILYQGAVNEARGFEQIIPAMQYVSVKLVIAGDGNFMGRLKKLIQQHHLEDKIILKGMLEPERLWQLTQQAYIGINFTEPQGLNQYLCLPNKFFDYIQAGIPQVTNDYPEYKKINARHEVALLIPSLTPENISRAINELWNNNELYKKLQTNISLAKDSYHWGMEEKKLMKIYHQIFA